MTRSDDVASALDSIGVLTRALAASGSHPLQGRKLSRSQMNAIFAISRTDGTSVGELAQSLGVSSSAATQTIDGLERLGLITREVDSRDGRARVIHLSAEARADIDEFQAKYIADLAPNFEALSAAELAQLARLLAKAVNNKRGSSRDPEPRKRT